MGMALLTALDAMPFESQIAFFEAFYASQEARLTERLKAADEHMPWIPTISLVHEGVVCDGCQMQPLKGLRFKCQDCPDYDLCGECFARKDSVHGGENSTHQFERIQLMPCMPWMQEVQHWMAKGACKGPCRKGKGKGMRAGNGKCKHARRSDSTDTEDKTKKQR